jgi:hypothetical protein
MHQILDEREGFHHHFSPSQVQRDAAARGCY